MKTMKTMKRIKRRMEIAKTWRSRNNFSKERYKNFIKKLESIFHNMSVEVQGNHYLIFGDGQKVYPKNDCKDPGE